jgi:hypothetical protein
MCNTLALPSLLYETCAKQGRGQIRDNVSENEIYENGTLHTATLRKLMKVFYQKFKINAIFFTEISIYRQIQHIRRMDSDCQI